jgi:hypothetical protein
MFRQLPIWHQGGCIRETAPTGDSPDWAPSIA